MDAYLTHTRDQLDLASEMVSTFDLCNQLLNTKMDFTCMIIDDEALARKRIRRLLDQTGNVKLLEECANGESAVEKITLLNPDFIFLDVKMKDMTGFEVLTKIKDKCLTLPIFVSAHNDSASKAFDHYAFDFLLKPFDEKRFHGCVMRVTEYLKAQKHRENSLAFSQIIREIHSKLNYLTFKPLEKIPIKLGNKTIFVPTQEIIFLGASGSYSELFLKDKKVVIRDSLTNIYKSLDSSQFLRIHRSTIINRDYIQEIQASSYYEIDVIMPKNRKFRVSKSYRKITLQKLGL